MIYREQYIRIIFFIAFVFAVAAVIYLIQDRSPELDIPLLPGGTGKDYDRQQGQGLYVLVDENGDVVYVGRGDAPSRISSHARNPVLGQYEGIILAENNLSYQEAVGLEQLLINYYGSTGKLKNQINSISEVNVLRDEVMDKSLPLLFEYVEKISEYKYRH